jgi:hypothetical protein
MVLCRSALRVRRQGGMPMRAKVQGIGLGGAAGAPLLPQATSLETWRQRPEDPERARAVWQQVREQPGACMHAAPYGQWVGSAEGVLQVLRGGADLYSVKGYGQRMQASVGLNHLGMDPGDGYEKLAPAVNQAIEGVTAREAFAATLQALDPAMDAIKQLPPPPLEHGLRVPLDLVTLSERVLAGLCSHWIGLPEDPATLAAGQLPYMLSGAGANDADAAGGPARCPGDLVGAADFIFAPHPRPMVLDSAPAQGRAVQAAVAAWLASGRRLGPLALKIRDGLMLGAAAERDAVLACCIAGVLLGFAPTVQGNFLRTMETWIGDKLLWACQQRLAEVPSGLSDPFARAEQALLVPLLRTMRERPLPDLLWRCPVVDGEAVHDADRRIVLGIAAALSDAGAPHELMFGGARRGVFRTVHACPGYGMGLGVLLGLLAGLLEAGTLRPTGSPLLLMLTPN